MLPHSIQLILGGSMLLLYRPLLSPQPKQLALQLSSLPFQRGSQLLGFIPIPLKVHKCSFSLGSSMKVLRFHLLHAVLQKLLLSLVRVKKVLHLPLAVTKLLLPHLAKLIRLLH